MCAVCAVCAAPGQVNSVQVHHCAAVRTILISDYRVEVKSHKCRPLNARVSFFIRTDRNPAGKNVLRPLAPILTENVMQNVCWARVDLFV